MSVNKLGEYLTASPKRQRQILQQLKYPKDSGYGATAYTETRNAIKDYFLNSLDQTYIETAIKNLEAKTPGTDFQEDMIASSIEALELVLESDYSGLYGLDLMVYSGINPKMNIKGVEVSVNPDLIIRGAVKGINVLGALKIHITKHFKLDTDGSQYVSTILYSFIEANELKDSETIKHNLCLSYDVFSQTFVDCPKSVKRRWENIEAGCQNIVAIWDSIEEPVKKS